MGARGNRWQSSNGTGASIVVDDIEIAAPRERAGDPATGAAALRVAIVVHLYYHHLWPEFAAHIRNVPAPLTLFVSIPSNSPAEERILSDFPDARVRQVPNIGRDVAPFLALLPELAAFDLVCKVHTKRDTPRHREWRIASLRNLLGTRAMVEQVIRAFATHPNLLMAGPRDLFLDGTRHVAKAGPMMRRAIDPLPEYYGFFAGTMFWARPSIFADFAAAFPQSSFAAHLDHDGHPEHALERLFGGTCRLGRADRDQFGEHRTGGARSTRASAVGQQTTEGRAAEVSTRAGSPAGSARPAPRPRPRPRQTSAAPPKALRANKKAAHRAALEFSDRTDQRE